MHMPSQRLAALTAVACAATWMSGAALLPAQAAPPPPAVAEAVREMDALDAMRSGLAASFAATGAPADQAAFAAVCKPVGQAMQRAALANGWQARQVAVKFRNPANKADPEAERALDLMARDPALLSLSLRTTKDGQAGIRYLRRITVEPSCLLCHGLKASRPAFIAPQYPDDRAHGFAPGDLRGAYSVFIPTPR
jgi:hypothetical protein